MKQKGGHPPIRHIEEYHTMHDFGIPRPTRSMVAYKILTEYLGNSNTKLHCGIVVDRPYCAYNAAADTILVLYSQ